MTLKRENNKTRKKILIGVAAFVAVLLALFLLRYPIMKAYANQFQKPRVGKQFDQTFHSIGPKLEELGFTYSGSPPAGFQTLTHRCSGIGRGLIFCYKSRSSDEQPITQAFIDNWKQHAPAFEAYLLENGWQAGEQRPMGALLDDRDPKNVLVNSLHYRHTDTDCLISLEYSSSQSNISAHETCSLDVTFPDLPESADY